MFGIKRGKMQAIFNFKAFTKVIKYASALKQSYKLLIVAVLVELLVVNLKENLIQQIKFSSVPLHLQMFNENRIITSFQNTKFSSRQIPQTPAFVETKTSSRNHWIKSRLNFRASLCSSISFNINYNLASSKLSSWQKNVWRKRKSRCYVLFFAATRAVKVIGLEGKKEWRDKR